MEDGRIPDGRITASSEKSSRHRAFYGRLNGVAHADSEGTWAANDLNPDQWIQVDLGE